MVVCRMTLMVCKKKRSEIEKKTKWWKLKKEECCEEFRQKLRQALGGQVVLPDDWETTAEVIRETGRKVLGVSSGRRKEDKETWWWNEEVQDSIQRKRLAKKKWDMDRTEENRQEYKELQRRVKREVSKAKQKAYDELYTRLDTREGEKDLYRLARQRDRDGKDVQQVRVIKDRDGRVLTSEESVQRRWKEYFEELMNEENEREKRVEGVNSVEQKVDKIRKDEVRKALKRMKSGKAVGPDDIPVEVWKCLGEAAVEFLASLFNRVLESERMPEEWRRSVLVPIFKNKGDVQSCSNYRGIKLMSHTMKVWERVVEARLRKVVEFCEQQYGFMPRKSTTDAIFALRILMEKYRDGQKELHCVFVDLEKAYDRVPREELWYCMRKSGVAEKYVRVVQDMYERSRTVVRCAVGQTEEFNVEVGLHQGSALSPFLFAIVMDQLSEEVRQESPWTMMFADDIVICSESREQVEENLERWRFALERRGMKVSRSKTEYMCVNEREGSGTVRLQGEEVKKVQEFKYLGSTVQSNGECGKEGTIHTDHMKDQKNLSLGLNWRSYEVLFNAITAPKGAGGNWATVGRRSRGGRRVRRQREKRKVKSVGLRIGTLNVGTMTGKGRELADMMERRKVDILCVQETRWKGSKARSIGAGFKLFYYGVDSKTNGVGVVLKEEFVRNVLEVGCELEEKERFWSELDEVMESIPTGDEEVMGKFGVKERNLEGQMVVDFAKRMDMGVVNTYFQKREEHRVTYKSGGRRTQIEKKTKWWKLKKEECSEVIRETGRKVLGVSSGRRKEDKETWWWNEEVQDSIQRKRLAKKKWDMDRTEENRQEYKELQRRVKREVSKAKQKAYEELYTRLDTREGEKDLYRLARQRDRDGKDMQQVRVIKDRDGRVLTSEESVQRRWKEYFEELMNEENEREKRVEGVNSVEQKVDKIRKDEVRKALKRMKSGKAVGPDDIPVEVWKCLGEAAVEFLANLFNRVLENLEKAYDRVPREELWYCMRKSGVAEKYVRVVQDMYERSRTVVRCAVGQTEEFNVEVGLHQGSALSPFLFAMVMDQLSEEVRQESPWTMMFADDIVICSESREQVEENLERWRFALERRGMKVSRSKTEYMCVNEREGSGTVRLQGEEVKKVQEFKYLGSTVQSNGECGKEVKKRVQAGWNGWRKVWGVLCDQKISARIKGKVYRTVVRPAMLYGLETVSLRKRQESELEVAELKMLRFSLGVTRLDRIRNEYIRGTAHVGRLGDKVREARLRWFGHVQRRDITDPDHLNTATGKEQISIQGSAPLIYHQDVFQLSRIAATDYGGDEDDDAAGVKEADPTRS
ncbi:hypothetical protein QTP86_009698 [Hemibagrus guttatus]|nr:hypothetical protein QTP86_009698 [Hemibagrus guttatus]